MTAVHDPRQPDTFAWRAAPSHLKTRRQLRAAGLRPNGQDPAALMVREPVGRKRRWMWAYLFDVRLAAPKRTATPAQLAAVEKAVREHQARAAERRGISRQELTQETDPGPGWTDPTTHQEENPMSDTITAPGGEAATREDPAGQQPQLGAPAGHGQRVAYLLATVAANQARQRSAKVDAAIGRVERGEDADWELEPKIREAMSQAETRLENIPWQNRTAMVASLADALVWSFDSELAQQRLDELTNSYALSWGVLIDPYDLTVSIDPDFEAEHFQRYAEAASVWDRESAVIDIVTALPMSEAAKDAATQAVMAWRGPEVDPLDPDKHRVSQARRREQLDVDLDAARLTAEDRARVEFVVDYLRGETSRVDLLTSPVIVDPGEEARGRVAALLEQFAHNPKSAREVGKQISVMTDADQERVRDVGRAIQAGQAVDFAVWPGYVNREAFREALVEYADDAAELRSMADYLAEGNLTAEEQARLGAVVGAITDDTNQQITRMATQRDQLLDQARHGHGLTSMERAQLVCTIEDIDAGVILGHEQLPELLFADERTKASVDFARTAEPAADLSNTTRRQITELVNTSSTAAPHSREDQRLRFEVSSMTDSLYSVATGSPGTSVELDRQQYTIKRTELDKALARAGVNLEVRQQIRTLVDDRARQAGELGRGAAARRQQWKDKTANIVAARDDAIAQRQAATAGHSPRSGRCMSRADRAAQAVSPGPARSAGRRSAHASGVER
ncbi:RRQRL motif-containing zinc-binding protein [Nocardia asiatica]|uniref:RRQRL motif-containing zinc-binding protein n=1 Tax=Nocardia asiatica TaxID=209252 RepID=UPI0024551245|nr:RRQRL motif-containing zinc-binding protein [Nocardia asiatica]